MSAILEPVLARRVRAGAKLLDEKSPGWHRDITGCVLNMQSCNECLLAQLFGNFATGLCAVGLYVGSDKGVSHGFSLWPAENVQFRNSLRNRLLALLGFGRTAWDVLADLWRAEIDRRLQADREDREESERLVEAGAC